MIIEPGSTRAQHLIAASREMGRAYGHPYVPRPRSSVTAWQMAIAWLEEYARRNPAWVNQIEADLEKPVVAWIVGKMGVSGAERVLATVFVQHLLDIVVKWAVARELGQSAPGSAQQMFNGCFLGLLGRWVASFVHELPVREAWPGL